MTEDIPETITQAQLEQALKELAVRTGNGNAYFPELGRSIFEHARAHRDTGEPDAEPDTRPDGIYGRVELPGRRDHTGWITGGPVWGTEGLIVRDWDGRIVADVVMGPGCQVVRLPTPLKRPDARKALPAGGWGWDAGGDDDEWSDGDE